VFSFYAEQAVKDKAVRGQPTAPLRLKLLKKIMLFAFVVETSTKKANKQLCSRSHHASEYFICL